MLQHPQTEHLLSKKNVITGNQRHFNQKENFKLKQNNRKNKIY